MSLHVDLVRRFSRNALSAFVLLSSVAIAYQPASGADLQPASAPPAAPALPTAAKIFDELRFGLSGSTATPARLSQSSPDISFTEMAKLRERVSAIVMEDPAVYNASSHAAWRAARQLRAGSVPVQIHVLAWTDARSMVVLKAAETIGACLADTRSHLD